MGEAMAESTNAQVQERFMAAVVAGDMETVRSLIHPDFELEEGSSVPFAGTYRGADGFLQFLGTFFQTFDIEGLEPIRVYRTDDPDWLAVEAELRGTIRATGKRYETSLVELWHFKDGKVVGLKPHYFHSAIAL